MGGRGAGALGYAFGMLQDRAAELDSLLERLSYLVTTARSTGVDDPAKLRDVIKQIRQVVVDAESLALTMQMEKQKDRRDE
jgi:hypothetical protein